MSLSGTSPVPNPFYEGGDKSVKIKFHSKIFCLSPFKESPDNAKYETLMESMYPFDPDSKIAINPYANNNGVTKSWTKEGDLLVQVEYIEYVEEEIVEIKADFGGLVTKIMAAGNGKIVMKVSEVDYEIPAGMEILVKERDEVRTGQVLARKTTPDADSREY